MLWPLIDGILCNTLRLIEVIEVVGLISKNIVKREVSEFLEKKMG